MACLDELASNEGDYEKHNWPVQATSLQCEAAVLCTCGFDPQMTLLN